MKRPSNQTLLLCAMVVVWIAVWFAINGYVFPDEDQAIHNSYVVHYRDSSLLGRDLTVANVGSHPSLLWPVLGFLVSVFPQEPLYFVLHILTVLAMLLAVRWWTLGLSPSTSIAQRAAWVAPLLVLVSHNTLAAIPMLDRLVLPRSLMLPVLLFALGAASRSRLGLAYALCGIAFCVHATTASHAAFLVFCISLVLRLSWKRVLLSTAWFAVFAAPLLIQMLRSKGASGVPFPPPAEWIDTQRMLVSFHHYISTFGANFILLLASVPALIVAIRWRMRVPLAVFGGVALFSLLGFVLIEGVEFPPAFQLHMHEITRFFPYCAAVVVAVWFARACDGEAHIAGPVLAGLALVIAPPMYPNKFPIDAWPLAVVAVLFVLVERRVRFPWTGRTWNPRWWLVVVATVAITTWTLLLIEREPADTAGRPMMAWAKDHLPTEALVVIPPDWGPEIHFRSLAERAIFVTLKDGGESTFSLDATRQWRERIAAVCNCDPWGDPVAKDALDTFLVKVEDSYKKIDKAHFLDLARRYGVTHAVTRADRTLEFPLLYSDTDFHIYELAAPR